MAYFNHAFRKTFLATAGDKDVETTGLPNVDSELPLETEVRIRGGLVDQSGNHVSYLKYTNLGFGPGTVGFYKAAGEGKDVSILPQELSGKCCPFYVAAASIKTSDKQGPYHGGYQEASKSKIVNPKYLRKAWGVVGTLGSPAVLEIGGTADNISANPACAKEFICGEDYNLRIDIKGAAALRFAHHNLYHTFQANGGCCDDPTLPTAVSPETIYLQWAEQIAESEFTKDFVLPLVEVTYDDPLNPGNAISNTYAADAAAAALAGLPVGNTFAALETLAATVTIDSAGLILKGAYVDTKFGDCTFQVSDYYGKEPLQIYASEVDYNGDPCTFEGLCVTDVCLGVAPEGLGETVIRDVIQSEAYLQNFFSSELRIREITQGTAAFAVVDRDAIYNSVFILHSVPRFNNPTGVFDNDQYLLQIVGDELTLKILAEGLDMLISECVSQCEPFEIFETEICEYEPKFVVPKS